jgi:hypothetical protein
MVIAYWRWLTINRLSTQYALIEYFQIFSSKNVTVLVTFRIFVNEGHCSKDFKGKMESLSASGAGFTSLA